MYKAKFIILGLLFFNNCMLKGSEQNPSLVQEALKRIADHELFIEDLTKYHTHAKFTTQEDYNKNVTSLEHYKTSLNQQTTYQEHIATLDFTQKQVIIHVNDTQDLAIPFNSFAQFRNTAEDADYNCLELKTIIKQKASTPTVPQSLTSPEQRTCSVLTNLKKLIPIWNK